MPIKNHEQGDGHQVVEVYARYAHPRADDPDPPPGRVSSASLFPASQQRDVKIDITNFALRSWNDTTHRYEVRPDTYSLEIGPSSLRTFARLNLDIK